MMRLSQVSRRPTMAESVEELLATLRFVGGPVETIYLNQTRTRESFITHLGAVESFTRTAVKKVSAETPVVKIGAGVSSGSDVTWSLSDPIAQVLVLRAALESQGLLYSIDNAVPGRYIRFAGTAVLSRPGVFDDVQQKALTARPGLYEELEAERTKAENISRMMGHSDDELWLLTLREDAVVCPVILSGEWLRDSVTHWVETDSPWELFAIVRGFYPGKVPNLAAIHVNIKW